MFITPKIARELVADATGRKGDNDFMVRIWTSAIFYFVLGVTAGILVGASAA